MNAQVKILTDRLDQAFLLGEDNDIDDEVRSHFSRYLCVIAAGYIEESVRILLTSYIKLRCPLTIQRYAGIQFQYITNLKSKKIKDLLNEFDVQWGKSFEDKIDQSVIDALDSIVSNRHLIAHGKAAGISYKTIREYWESAKIAIEILDRDIVNAR